MTNKKRYIWCTYRNWSFHILEALQHFQDWKTSLIVTIDDCVYDFSSFEKLGIPIIKVDPKSAKTKFQKSQPVYETIANIQPSAIISPGWSWYIPSEILSLCPCVTLHPGKLPKDRGGSPIQNQIRNGEQWTYLNVMKQVKGLDEGPIYFKEKIILDGSADDVWKRMTSTGLVLTRNFLNAIANNTLVEHKQSDEEPTLYKRVKPIDARLDPFNQSAEQMNNIIRAHCETDPNSYVIPAFLKLNDCLKLEIHKSSLQNKNHLKEMNFPEEILAKENLYSIIADINNNKMVFKISDKNGKSLFLTQINLRLF